MISVFSYATSPPTIRCTSPAMQARSLLCIYKYNYVGRFFLPPLRKFLPMGLHFVQDTQQDLSERDTRGHILGLKISAHFADCISPCRK